MPDEEQLRQNVRQTESAELQMVNRELSIDARMRQLALQGKSLAAINYDMEGAYRILQAIKALAPMLGQAIQIEAREQAVSDTGARQIGAEEAQAGQAGGQEKRLDAREIQVLKDILRRLVDINDKRVKQGSGANAQVMPDVVADIQRIKQDLGQLVQLQRVEFSAELKEEMLKGEKNQAIINLIRQERQFFGLLTQYITTVEQLLTRNGSAGTIQMYIRRAIDLIKKLIAINSMEMRSI